MPRSLGNKRKQIPDLSNNNGGNDKGIGFITRLYGDFEENDFVKRRTLNGRLNPTCPKHGLMKVKPKSAMRSISPNIFTSSNPCARWRKSRRTSWPWKPVLWNWKKQCWRIDHG